MLMAAGSFGSLIVGLSFPAMNIVYGRVRNALNEPSGFVGEINTLCVYLIYISVATIIGGFLQVRLLSGINFFHHLTQQCRPLTGVLLDLHG